MTAPSHRPVLVVDFGAQYAQLIARRVREAKVYSEIVPSSMPVAEMLAKDPAAVILSGGPSSVYADGAPQVDPALFGTGVPTFGICYGFQAMAQALGGEVAQTGLSEFGGTQITVTAEGSTLFAGTPSTQTVWMSHGDAVHRAPDGFTVVAVSDGAPVAGFEDTSRGLAGVQFHPEVMHSEHGQKVLEHFLYDIAKLEPTWTASNVIDEQVESIRSQVGDKLVICGLSGGVDSAVAAALVHKAVGDNLTCVFVDHGLLRKGEREQVETDYVAATGIRLKVVDASDRFLDELDGVTDPEEKRKIIGRLFIRVFEDAAREVVDEAGAHGQQVEFLVQGTLYPDVVESGGGTGTANIKSHHNVGGLPDDLQFALSAPSSACRTRWCGATRSRARASPSASSAPCPATASRCCARPTRSSARRPRPRASTATSGSCRSCCSPTSARWASRATVAPTATPSCCAPCRARTP